MKAVKFLEKHTSRFWLASVFIFLYIPLLFLIVFSFNDTRQDGVFTGFSLRWYQALLTDSRLVAGFWLSLKVALLAGTLSVVLGCFTAFVLPIFRHFAPFGAMASKACACGKRPMVGTWKCSCALPLPVCRRSKFPSANGAGWAVYQ